MMNRSETLSKLVPLRTRTDPVEHDETRSGNRKPLPVLRTKGKGTSYRQAAKDTVQSALELRPPITFEHFLRRDKKTPVQSRRNSTDNDLHLVREQTRQLRRYISKDVSKIVEQNERRQEELKQALQQVEEQGTRYTRQLDETYYALLERGEALRQTVTNLQHLAEESRTLHTRFERETSELERNMNVDVDGYQNFTEQEEAIRDMLAKLDASKERSASLNGRLDVAHKRVEASKQRIIHAQIQRRKRWRLIWAVCGIVFAVLLAVWAAKKNAELNVRIQLHDALPLNPNPVRPASPSPSEDEYINHLFDGIS